MKINNLFKKYLTVVLVGFLFLNPICTFAASQKATTAKSSTNVSKKIDSNVLQGSVSVDINPYCKNWSSQYAFNKINTIGTKLQMANNLTENMKFVVKKDNEVNASTNINNVISVNMGLLQYVETEDELAFVIGHEMGHVTKNHVLKSGTRNAVLTSAGLAGAVATVVGVITDTPKLTKSGAVLAGGAIVGKVADQKLSRGQETRADLASIDYLVKAGYNPLAAISMLNKISGNYFDFFSDHPSGKNRIKKSYKYIEKHYPEYLEKGYNSVSYERALIMINNKNK